MAQSSFEGFSALPYELRTEIWLAALPQARLVRLEEHEKEEFDESKYDDVLLLATNRIVAMGPSADENPIETCTDVLVDISKCDPDRILRRFRHECTLSFSGIAPYFMSSARSQTQLEDHGFRTKRPRPSLACIHLLQHCGAQALYDATRTTELFSKSPIPVLLHTCRESRIVMQQIGGYKLAFSGLNSEPLVWFNFKQDILHLNRRCWNQDETLPGPYSFLDRIPAEDLARVERLALFPEQYLGTVDFCDSIPLFHRLRELFWDSLHICKPRPREPDHDYWGHKETESDLWGYLECHELDFLDERILDFPFVDLFHRYNPYLKQYCNRNGGKYAGFLDANSETNRRVLEESKRKTSGTWAIPKVISAYLVTRSLARLILSRRTEVQLELAQNEMLLVERAYDQRLRFLHNERMRELENQQMSECLTFEQGEDRDCAHFRELLKDLESEDLESRERTLD